MPRFSTSRPATRLSIALIGLLASAAALAAPQDDKMMRLANFSGCLICHHIDSGAKGPDGLAPIGPAWRDVAAKYRADKGAADRLTQTVLKGSNPYESHWKGQASGLAMPPNAVAIKEADAKDLVRWILQLQAK
ncbi:MAG: c-type cytochrome [Burkholderiales bacterium]|nr:c-type cytochrome [Burkholderiales bacterium]